MLPFHTTRPAPYGRSRSQYRASFERLESRSMLAVFAPTTIVQLRAAITAANTNADAVNTINLAATHYRFEDDGGGELLLRNDNAAAVSNKTLNINGAGAVATAVDASFSGARDFEIVGANLAVNFAHLNIEEGEAGNGGLLGGLAALGGGMLVNGSRVTLVDVLLSGTAQGADGPSALGDPGVTVGGNGANALGGALYLASGSVTIVGGYLSGAAYGGGGGQGKIGGYDGGWGGSAKGGAAYVAGGSLTLIECSVNGYTTAGSGGAGGLGSAGGHGLNLNNGGPGGAGGGGNHAFGGAFYVAGGAALNIFNNDVDGEARAGSGGPGGGGGFGYNFDPPGNGGNGGNGATGGNVYGGAYYFEPQAIFSTITTSIPFPVTVPPTNRLDVLNDAGLAGAAGQAGVPGNGPHGPGQFGTSGLPGNSGQTIGPETFGTATPASTATRLRVVGPPPGTSALAGSVNAGAGFGLVIFAEDNSGAVNTSYSGTVTVSLADNPGGSTLGGTLSVAAVGGVAKFTGLTLNKAGIGYLLSVASGGLAVATSAPFDVVSATPGSRVNALPARTSSTSIPVSWTGSGGTAPLTYDVLLSVDGGAFTSWLTATSQTSATYNGAMGHTYGFYTKAHDNAGHVEAAHGGADASVVTTPTPWKNPGSATDVDANGLLQPLDALNVINFLIANGQGPVPSTAPIGSRYVDVTGDNSVTPLDALVVINALIALSSSGSLGTVNVGPLASAGSALTLETGASAGITSALAIDPDAPKPTARVAPPQALVYRPRRARLG